MLDGRFRLESVLGRGGMATVWSAHDCRLDRRVAIKILHDHLSGEDVARVEREARAAARVTDARVVTVLDLDHTDDGRPYLVFEALSGRTLADEIREHGALAPDRLERLAADLLGGVGAAHACGVLHRDIKPSNVLVDEAGFRITDFGIASVDDETATQGDLIGTLSYLAPERFDGAPATEASDVFATAAVLYEAATGRQPFRAPTAAETVQRLRSGVHDPLPGEMSSEMRDIITRGLAPDPERRPNDAGALADAAAPSPGDDVRPTDPAPTERLDHTQRLTTPVEPDVEPSANPVGAFGSDVRDRVDDLLEHPRVADAVDRAKQPPTLFVGVGVLLLLLLFFAATRDSDDAADATTTDEPTVLLDRELERIEELG